MQPQPITVQGETGTFIVAPLSPHILRSNSPREKIQRKGTKSSCRENKTGDRKRTEGKGALGGGEGSALTARSRGRTDTYVPSGPRHVLPGHPSEGDDGVWGNAGGWGPSATQSGRRAHCGWKAVKNTGVGGRRKGPRVSGLPLLAVQSG